ncbi:Uncharacterized membrane-anchored protein YitT, contains DUF161 and DUF2179 domains [Dethiosulfatibacter aminovorans DSM 17477]|uniref:Uncharacterized membrane-anchored protein YitT, contains DUF161 and DUF2179 domains n=1 Tax=Dethiosulfatibacter aminovorans DSM 17477 TaxID=1121476 RepID=A0A1M6B0T2_9FIRM|nr:YitT family protein [Dethiosulfatibacter aminovorans]SHI42301.1 Uncharacterized membrane-anchored protein YitT, contains DUF161 and DUF2179 domains [Dethiosulfatibacter aminovorans DSM 17477]
MKKHEKFDKFKNVFIDYLFLIVGNSLMAFAITAILRPNKLITGGITGISLLIDNLMGIPYTIYYYALTITVLILALIFLGKKKVGKIIMVSIIFPPMLILFESLNFRLVQNDMFLAAIFYGVISGAGYGLIVTRGFSFAGTDAIARIIHNKLLPFIGVSQLMLVADILIISTSIIKYDINTALYAILTMFIYVRTLESVLYGFSDKKVKLEIISDMDNEIEKYILNTIGRGISKYNIIGGYTNKNKIKVVSICTPRESLLIRNFVSDLDENAFMDVMPVNSVWGSGLGFEPLREEK